MESVLPEDTEETDQSQQQYTKTPEDSAKKSWSGFKIVGDNIDKTVFASFQRLDDNTTCSLNYFHAYAAKDRIDFSRLSDSQPSQCEMDLESLLPSQSDVETIKGVISVLLSRYQ